MKLLTTITILAIVLVAFHGAGAHGLDCCNLNGEGCKRHIHLACKSKDAKPCKSTDCHSVAFFKNEEQDQA